MKYTMLQTAVFASLVGLTSVASADEFTIDSQPNATAAITSSLSQMENAYYSTTTIFDTNSDMVFSAGDKFTGTGGLLNSVAGPNNPTNNIIDTNLINAFLPGLANIQNYKNDWLLSFGWSNLSGVIDSNLQGQYTGGEISLYYFDKSDIDAGNLTLANAETVMTVEVTSGGGNDLGQSLDIIGEVTSAKTDMFTFTSGSAAGKTFDDLIGQSIDINFLSTQNTSPFWINGFKMSGLPSDEVAAATASMYWRNTDATTGDAILPTFDLAGNPTGNTGYDGKGYLSGEHKGDFQFQVPEPASIALLGLGLIGFAGYKRRK